MARNHTSRTVRRTAVRIDISCQNLFSPRQLLVITSQGKAKNVCDKHERICIWLG